MTHWTDSETCLLKKHYNSITYENLIKMLPSRSKRSIIIKAHRLGLSKTHTRRDSEIDAHLPMIDHLTENEKYYLAGIIDGEGCVSFTRSKSQYSDKYIYRMQLTITNTSNYLLNWLNVKFEGRCHVCRSIRRKNNKRECWDWVISGPRRTTRFLEEMAPYLIIKKDQANLLKNGYIHLDDNQRERLFFEVRRLKHDN